MIDGRSGTMAGGRDGAMVAGIVLGVVHDVDDPNGWGRVRVRYPWLDGYAISDWAPIASPLAGNDYGMWIIPEHGDEAVLAFDRGRVDKPYVLGFVWNGVDKAPSRAVRERMFRSVNGHTIRFLDSTPTPGGNRGGIAIEDAHGNAIVMTNGKITIRSAGILELAGAHVVATVNGLKRKFGSTPNSV
jgi:uncharacterized protein involved in type VI secretion and phage assembly